jgi:hypothetical protein
MIKEPNRDFLNTAEIWVLTHQCSTWGSTWGTLGTIIMQNIVAYYWLNSSFRIINGFIGCLLLVNTNSYNPLTILHNIQTITATYNFYVLTTRCLVAVSNNGDSLYCIRAQRLMFSTANDNCVCLVIYLWQKPAQSFLVLGPAGSMIIILSHHY